MTLSETIPEKNMGEMMRQDLHQSLNKNYIDPSKLSVFQRILLTTDGTLTEILAAYLFEEIKVVKLSENLIKTPEDIPQLEIKQESEVIDRKILLQGKISHKNFIYAESVIIPDRLDERFKDELLHSKTSLGRLWLKYKVETYKEIIDSSKEPADKFSAYFPVASGEYMLSRSYRVFSQGQLIMMITEKFPESYFVKGI
jgi:chorismate-pyruvate lyase